MLYCPIIVSSSCRRVAGLLFQRLANCSWAVLRRVRGSAVCGKPKRQDPSVNLPQYALHLCSTSRASFAFTSRLPPAWGLGADELVAELLRARRHELVAGLFVGPVHVLRFLLAWSLPGLGHRHLCPEQNVSVRVTPLLPFDPDDAVGDLEGRALLGHAMMLAALIRRRSGDAGRIFLFVVPPGYLPHCPRRSAGPASAGTDEAGAGTAAPRWPAAGCTADWRRGRPTGSPRPGTAEEARRLVALASQYDQTV